MRILRLSRKMARMDMTVYIKPSVVRLIKLLGKIVYVAHLIGCMWSLVDECDNTQVEEWTQCGGEGLGSKYLASFYWTIATLMSVGYGDVSANTNNERLYALLTEVIGATAFGFIIAMVTVIVETMDPQATAKNGKMDEIREYIVTRGLSKSLQLLIRKHFDYFYGRTSVFEEVPILRDLPYTLRMGLAQRTHGQLVNTLHFFNGFDIQVITEVVYRLKPMQMLSKEYLGKTGDVLDESFFVVEGRVEARRVMKGNQVIAALHSGGSSFELGSLVLHDPMQFTYRALVQSELMWLDREDLSTITTEYKSSQTVIMDKASTL
ncbi:unnamed protein product [Choristocarpus tenellus]